MKPNEQSLSESDERGDVEIETLIMFITLVFVAAITTGVLLNIALY